MTYCCSCGRSFNHEHVRDVHERKCPGYRLVHIVACRICLLDFPTSDLLREHFEHSHGSRYPFMCAKCKCELILVVELFVGVF
jgi:hypothetical protein